MSKRTPLVRVEREGDLPLSFAQQRLWFLDRMVASPAFTSMTALRLEGDLDPERLQRALDGVVGRHEMLRTGFAVVDGEPVQRVERETVLPLERLDLSELDPAEHDAAVERAAEELVDRPFDLERAPLVRARLVKLGERLHALLLSAHHIAADGSSMAILVRELGRLYGDDAPPPLEVQYGDYTLWQRDLLAGDVLEEGLAYWRSRLEGLEPLELFTDRPRPAMLTYRGASHAFEIPEGVTEALDALGRREGYTLTMILLAAWQVVLARHGGSEDVAVGLPAGNRSHVELEGLIGLFTSTLIVRTDLSGDPRFLDDLLPQVREVALQAFEHQDIPFQKIVEAIDPPRDPSRHPLFQAMFSMFALPRESVRLGDVEAESIVLPATRTGLDFDLRLRETRGRVTGRLIWASDLFEEQTVERTVDHFLNLLAGIAADPHARLSELPLLGERERHRLLVEWSSSPAEPPGPCVHERFEAQVERSPRAVAAVCGEAAIRYAELDAAADGLAHELRALGAGPEVLVGLCVERSLDLLVGLLGILKSGAAYVPLDPSLPERRLAAIVEEHSIGPLVTRRALRARLPEDHPTIELDAHGNRPAARSETGLQGRCGPHRLAYLITTSGSTGRPKGVAVEHRSLSNLLDAMASRPGLGADDVLVAVTPVSFDIAALELFLPLIVGARVVIAPEPVASDGRALARLMQSCGATLVQATPATWRLLVESGWEGDPRLRVLCGGESLPRALAVRLASRCGRLWNLYGPTEATVWSLVHEVEPSDGSDAALGPVPIGRPIPGTEAYVLDRDLHPVPIGVVGELCLAGVGLARGYWRSPKETASAFVPHPFDAGARLYRTGDRASVRADGTILFHGRTDRQVKLRGHRIELGEVEHALASHPGVSECAVVLAEGLPDPQLVAHVVARSLDDRSPVDLRTHLQSRLPGFMLPARFVSHEFLPLTPNGKLDYGALAAQDGTEALVRDGFVAPGTPTEVWLAEVWSRLLDVDRIGVHDNFFDLGGHSLLAMKVVFEVEERMGVTLLPREFLTRTLGQLARTCEQRGRPVGDPPASTGWLARIGRLLRPRSRRRGRA